MSEVVIVGAGMAGLTCARRLQRDGVECVVLDAADAVGGRVRTDVVQGFRLDRGFQVLLTAYSTARQWLDYESLSLMRFTAGALVWCDGRMCLVGDPWREPRALLARLRAPVGSLRDKVRWPRCGLRRERVRWKSCLRGPRRVRCKRCAPTGSARA